MASSLHVPCRPGHQVTGRAAAKEGVSQGQPSASFFSFLWASSASLLTILQDLRAHPDPRGRGDFLGWTAFQGSISSYPFPSEFTGREILARKPLALCWLSKVPPRALATCPSFPASLSPAILKPSGTSGGFHITPPPFLASADLR